VSALLGFELANVCLIKTWRHPAQGAALAAAFVLRHRLGVEEMPIDHDGTLDLAVQTEALPLTTRAIFCWCANSG